MIPHEVRRLLHEAVAADDATCVLIDSGNACAGFATMSPERAARHAGAYSVILKPHLMALDCDHEDGIERMRDVLNDLDLFGMSAVLLASGGEGRAHLWVSVVEDDVRIVQALAEKHGADLRHTSNRMRPPMSPHRSGATSMRLLVPECVEEAVERLKPRGTPPDWPSIKKAAEAEKTCRENRRTGAGAGLPVSQDPPRLSATKDAKRLALLSEYREKGNRSEQLMALAGMYVYYGLSIEQLIEDVLANPGGAGAKLYADYRNRQGREAYMRRTWLNACENTHGRAHVEDGAAEKLAAVVEAANAYPWSRHQNSADAVLRAVIEKAEALGTTTLSFGVRQIALMTGIGKDATAKAVSVLREIGFMRVVEAASGFTANTYELMVPTLREPDTMTHPARGSKGVSPNVSALVGWQDAFHRRPGLKRVAYYLMSGSATCADLAVRLNRGYESTRQRLKDLERFGLAWCDDAGVWHACVESQKLIETAKANGSFGVTERRARDYKQATEDYQSFIVKQAIRGVDVSNHYRAQRVYVDVVHYTRRRQPRAPIECVLKRATSSFAAVAA
jgi:hypothetical protein